ncbi:MAG: 16S rRNA (cytosine(1402)-N(4))-methyltransferase [Gammaproteobacteria bacterium 28-57-27]|nr:MAG: 16S rRNA (cytosine(1402)-N(4))-methyltransferase [Gammaproteobacteria bacterium 28-57-27]
MTDSMQAPHLPVMLDEVLAALDIQSAGVYVDATFGRGGHSGAILQRLGTEGRLIALDRDPSAVAEAQSRFASDPRFTIVHSAFSALRAALEPLGVWGKVNGLLLDLGVSSPQLDEAERGFSFMRDGPLDMRMDPSCGESAAEFLARVDEAELADILWRLGEERFSRQIARSVVAVRSEAPITRTGQLAELIAKVVFKREPGKHPATRSFQALRLWVNQELAELDAVLPLAREALAIGGRLAVISFHSLEDRRVKQFLRGEQMPELPPEIPLMLEPPPAQWRTQGRAIKASVTEIAHNPRSRSAVLRVAERLI